MRYACLVWLIAGCGFASQPGAADDPGGDPGGPGAGGSGSAGSGSGGTGTGRCDVSDASLRLCVSFGTDPMAQDLSGAGHALVAAKDVLPLAGLVGGTAGTFGLSSQLRFAESKDFDVADLTFEFWMSPTVAPLAGARGWMLDNNMQYSASYELGGAVRCGIGSTMATSQTTVALGGWHHVACSYSKADQQLSVHVDGDVSGCAQVDSIPTGGKDGIAIGANYGGGKYSEQYVGGLGRLHLYARALGGTEICQLATGRTDCNTRCPGSDGSDGG